MAAASFQKVPLSLPQRSKESLKHEEGEGTIRPPLLSYIHVAIK